jgi:hypothetical protein
VIFTNARSEIARRKAAGFGLLLIGGAAGVAIAIVSDTWYAPSFAIAIVVGLVSGLQGLGTT